MTAATIVAMTRAHIDALMAYEHDMFGTEAWTAGSYRDELAETRTRHYVALEGDDGDLLGWAGAMIVDGAAEVLTVGVVPAARRRGLARLLLADLYAASARRGASEIFLEVRVDNEPAIALYDDEGFAPVGRRRGYYDHGRIDAMVMRRGLDDQH